MTLLAGKTDSLLRSEEFAASRSRDKSAVRLGDRDEAARISESLEDHRRPFQFGAVPFWRARIASVLGDYGTAMRFLTQAEREGFMFTSGERLIIDLQPMRDYWLFVEWLEPRG